MIFNLSEEDIVDFAILIIKDHLLEAASEGRLADTEIFWNLETITLNVHHAHGKTWNLDVYPFCKLTSETMYGDTIFRKSITL